MQFRFGPRASPDVITVNTADRTSLLAAVRTRLGARQGFAVATLNLDHLVKLRRDAGFRRAYLRQDLVVADGNPIVWLSRLAHRPVSLVPGSDLVVPLAQLAAELGVGVALVGATDATLETAARRLMTDIPGLIVTARIAPPMGFDPMSRDAESILREVAARGTGLCLLALGAPKQEMLAAQGRIHAPAVGFVSIGAGLDFLAGTQTRAPAFVRALAMEWLWRALTEPRRLIPRYAACAAILPEQAAAAWRMRRKD